MNQPTLRLPHAALAMLCLALTTTLATAKPPTRHFLQTNLVSDVPGLAAATDPHLVNPWGLVANATGPWWIANNGTGTSTLYNGAGIILPLVVTLPNIPGTTDPSAPTGIVFNGVPMDFLVAPAQPARFIFASEEGTITAWNSGPNAVLMVNKAGWAVYKGLALATNNGAQFLYAANFMTGRIDVFDRTFQPVSLGADAFVDPELPEGYAPFNVQKIGNALYVAFALKEEGSIEEVPGPGKGFVDVFSTAGVLQRRLQWGAWFNAPWGVALAPADFGRFGGMLLVGQFGSGRIAAFDPDTGRFRGMLRGNHGRPLAIEGLWGLAFGNGANAGPVNTLYFTAGIEDEAHGLFGTLTPLPVSDDDDEGDNEDGD
ncbi:MAG TPA: TIGR03118 family protein [Lacunisphaera sp.]